MRRLGLTLCAFSLLVIAVFAASEGPRSPSTVVNATGFGTVAWTNPGNATASDDSRATSDLANQLTSTNYLKATDFGFAIPTGATIDGIVVEFECSQSFTGVIETDHARMVKGGTISGSSLGGGVAWGGFGGDAYLTVGSSTEKWGLTWAASDINGSTFGCVVVAKNVNGDADAIARVDHIRMTVHYTEAAAAKPPRRAVWTSQSQTRYATLKEAA